MVTFGTPTEQSNCKIKELWLGCVHYEPQVNTGHCMSSLHELPELLLQTAWWWRRHSAALATHSVTCSTTSVVGTLVCMSHSLVLSLQMLRRCHSLSLRTVTNTATEDRHALAVKPVTGILMLIKRATRLGHQTG